MHSFVGNVCPEAGGGVYYTLGRSVDLTQLYTFVVLDSKFIANRADYGGGLYIITGGIVIWSFEFLFIIV